VQANEKFRNAAALSQEDLLAKLLTVNC